MLKRRTTEDALRLDTTPGILAVGLRAGLMKQALELLGQLPGQQRLRLSGLDGDLTLHLQQRGEVAIGVLTPTNHQVCKSLLRTMARLLGER